MPLDRSQFPSTLEIYRKGGASELVYVKYASDNKERSIKINAGVWYALIGRYK